MSSGRVVEAVDVARNPDVRSQFCWIRSTGFLVFQRGEERLSHYVVPAISLAIHARHEAEARERAPEVVARVLIASVRVEQHASMSARALPGVQEGLLDQVIRHAVAEAVTQHLSGLDAHHHRQIQPALAGCDIGDITDPRRREARNIELSVEQILGDRTSVTAVGGTRFGATFGLAAQTFFTHQPRHAFGPHGMAHFAQVGHQSGTPIGATALDVALLEVTSYRRVYLWLWSRLTAQVVMETRARDIQQSAQDVERKLSPFKSDEGVSHLDSLAKNAVAFF